MMNYKIILVGTYSAGKTSLTIRLLKNKFSKATDTTIGAAFMIWTYLDPETNEQLQCGIWDTAGQERFGSLLPMYLRNADIVLYCWDYSKPFDTAVADDMYQRIRSYSPNCFIYLVFTKIDLAMGIDIKQPNAENWAHLQGIDGIWYTSSLTGEGIHELFKHAAQDLLTIEKEPPMVDFDPPSPETCCKN